VWKRVKKIRFGCPLLTRFLQANRIALRSKYPEFPRKSVAGDTSLSLMDEKRDASGVAAITANQDFVTDDNPIRSDDAPRSRVVHQHRRVIWFLPFLVSTEDAGSQTET
jgi:hypothetical protein